MAVDPSRLNEGQVITTQRPEQQDGFRKKYPILLVTKIDRKKNEILLLDTDTAAPRLLGVEDLRLLLAKMEMDEKKTGEEGEEKKILVLDTNIASRLLKEEDLQSMLLVGVSLRYKDKFIYESRGGQREVESLLLEICREAVKNNPEFRVYLEELATRETPQIDLGKVVVELAKTLNGNPTLRNEVKQHLQEEVGKPLRIDQRMATYKATFGDSKTVRGS